MKSNNKLIADFLGYTQPHPDYPNTSYWYKKNEEPLCLLMFDSDWNWLIKAVEKIESIKDKNGDCIYIFEILLTNVNITDNRNVLPIIEIYEQTKINAVYTAVVEFIKYYNELNK